MSSNKREHIDHCIAEAKRYKAEATALFSTGEYRQAIRKFKLMIPCLKGLNDDFQSVLSNGGASSNASLSEKGQHFGKDSWQYVTSELLFTCANNLAACYLKENNPKLAVKYANEALMHEPDNVKARLRRLQANLDLKNLDHSLPDYQFLEKSNQIPVQALKSFESKIAILERQENKKERQAYSGLFAKMSDI